MTDLIITQTQIGTENTNAVTARDFHEALKVKKDFSDWIKQQLMIGRKNSVYVEGIDYLKNHLKGVRTIEYILSLDTAKRLSMLSKTKKGNEVREYFIEAEKKNTQSLMSPTQIMKSLQLTAQSLQHQDERMDQHHNRIQEVEVNVNTQDERLQHLEQNRRLDTWQEKALIDTHHKKVYQLADQYKEDSRDKKLISSLHRKIWQLFKRHFSLPRYNELSVGKFDSGIKYINSLEIGDLI